MNRKAGHKKFRLYLLYPQCPASHAARLFASLMLDLNFARRGAPATGGLEIGRNAEQRKCETNPFSFSISTKQTGCLVRSGAPDVVSKPPASGQCLQPEPKNKRPNEPIASGKRSHRRHAAGSGPARPPLPTATNVPQSESHKKMQNEPTESPDEPSLSQLGAKRRRGPHSTGLRCNSARFFRLWYNRQQRGHACLESVRIYPVPWAHFVKVPSRNRALPAEP